MRNINCVLMRNQGRTPTICNHPIIQWNDFSKDTSVAGSHNFNIMFEIFPTMVDDRHLGKLAIHFISCDKQLKK